MSKHTNWQKALIQEAACIGCAKCLAACPVDAIVGAAKFMHTVITDECIGCRLCIEPCPVDCIDMYTLPLPAPETRKQIAQQARKRVTARQKRLAQDQTKLALTAQSKVNANRINAEIIAAVTRARQKHLIKID
jgi:electron transport complex protein RnfB